MTVVDSIAGTGYTQAQLLVRALEGERFALNGDVIDYEDKTPIPPAE